MQVSNVSYWSDFKLLFWSCFYLPIILQNRASVVLPSSALVILFPYKTYIEYGRDFYLLYYWKLKINERNVTDSISVGRALTCSAGHNACFNVKIRIPLCKVSNVRIFVSFLVMVCGFLRAFRFLPSFHNWPPYNLTLSSQTHYILFHSVNGSLQYFYIYFIFLFFVFQFSRDNDWDFMPARFWVGMWTVLFILLIVIFNLSALVKYITRFTEESFATLIALIFIVEAFKKLFEIEKYSPVNFDPNGPIPTVCHCVHQNCTSDLISNTSYLYTSNYTCADYMDLDLSGLATNSCITQGGYYECGPKKYVGDVFFFSILLFLGTFSIAIALIDFKRTTVFPSMVSHWLLCLFEILPTYSTYLSNGLHWLTKRSSNSSAL